MSNFSNAIRDANAQESARDAAALSRELSKTGAPSPRDLGKLVLLRSAFPLPAPVFDAVLKKARTRKKS